MLPVIFVTALALSLGGAHQPSTVTVTVIDAGARYPLTNADIIDLASGQRRLTDESGQARMPWPENGQLRLRVREVGYKPVQRTFHRDSAPSEATIIEMSRVAYVISPVKATSHCVTTDDSASLALSVAVLDQLKQEQRSTTSSAGSTRSRWPSSAVLPGSPRADQ